MTFFFTQILLLTTIIYVSLPQVASAAHGVSLDGILKYPAEFKQFEYVSTEATKGGDLVLHENGSFDKLNPFSLKGEAPLGIEMFVFEPLAVSSQDEPFALYGLLAQNIELANDKNSVTFTLNPDARFSDNTEVTAKDVAYTIDVLKGKSVHPYYNFYYQDIEGYEILGEKIIRVNFKQPNRELHLITCQMRIMPKALKDSKFWEEGKILPVGSGPYTVSEFKLGKTIAFKRNTNYWAVDHPTRKAMFNYDNIVVKYYKDQTIALEAFKAGEFDFMTIYIAKQWARDLVGPKFNSGTLIKKAYPHSNNAGLQGFVFNTRREIFKNKNVRKALGLAFDFDWTNKSLFHNQYTRNNSFFSNSPLAATGTPEGLELTYLLPFRDELPAEVFNRPLGSPRTNGKKNIRQNLLAAKLLLKEAGWTVREGVLKNREGREFKFDIILSQPSIERVMAGYVKNLKKIGIQANYRSIDSALYVDRVKKFDFDMIVATYGQSQSPGNEQRSYWHSETADEIGSRNYAGIRSPIVDNLVEKIIYAKNQQQLTAACRALDRVLWYGYYVVPNWYLDVHRLTYNDTFLQPKTLPVYYNPYQLLMTWWKR